jgi:crotonobetainyl-CoA:carnitine CoA-transferase CaiB-like acyl-CoA transferase
MLPLPLVLLRVLDLTSSQAGALATRIMGDLGAEVIRVEPSDVARDTSAPDDLACSKLSLALDVASPQGREVLLSLVAACNFVFMDSESAPLDYEAIADARPSAIVVVLDGDGPDVGLAAAAAAMTALFHHRETGEGQRIDVVQAAVSANLRSIALLAAGLKGSAAPPAQPSATGGTAAMEPVARISGDVQDVLSLPYRLSRTPVHVRLPAPRPGEHTRYVLRELLRLDDERIEQLRSAGVVAGV